MQEVFGVSDQRADSSQSSSRDNEFSLSAAGEGCEYLSFMGRIKAELEAAGKAGMRSIREESESSNPAANRVPETRGVPVVVLGEEQCQPSERSSTVGRRNVYPTEGKHEVLKFSTSFVPSPSHAPQANYRPFRRMRVPAPIPQPRQQCCELTSMDSANIQLPIDTAAGAIDKVDDSSLDLSSLPGINLPSCSSRGLSSVSVPGSRETLRDFTGELGREIARDGAGRLGQMFRRGSCCGKKAETGHDGSEDSAMGFDINLNLDQVQIAEQKHNNNKKRENSVCWEQPALLAKPKKTSTREPSSELSQIRKRCSEFLIQRGRVSLSAMRAEPVAAVSDPSPVLERAHESSPVHQESSSHNSSHCSGSGAGNSTAPQDQKKTTEPEKLPPIVKKNKGQTVLFPVESDSPEEKRTCGISMGCFMCGRRGKKVAHCPKAGEKYRVDA